MQIILNEDEVLIAVKEYLQRRGFEVEESRARFETEPEDADVSDWGVLSDVTTEPSVSNQTE